MARYSGLVGFAHQERTAPGVISEVITEKGPYKGDLKRESLTQRVGERINGDFGTSNTIEIVAGDRYVSENVFAIRFVVWAGVCWTVSEVTVQHPRLLLRLGGVYNGPRAA